jgi:hypothetical protein
MRRSGDGRQGLLVVQPTRVVPRKGIELAIELVGRLGDPDSVLLITSPAGDEGLEYLVQLERMAQRAGVRLQYAADRFEPDHEGIPIGPAHTLGEAYAAADLITYPSLYEGFGNALIEAVFHGRPVVVNRYPVYVADIAPLGMELIEIDGAITDETVATVRAVLANPARQRRVARRNFEIAQRHLSYKLLRRRLRRCLTGRASGRQGVIRCTASRSTSSVEVPPVIPSDLPQPSRRARLELVGIGDVEGMAHTSAPFTAVGVRSSCADHDPRVGLAGQHHRSD